MTVERQAAEVDKVKRSESGMILTRSHSGPSGRSARRTSSCGGFKISGVPIVDGQGPAHRDHHQRDLQFERNLEQPSARR